MIDSFIYFALPFGYLPIFHSTPNRAKNIIGNSLDKMRKALFSSFRTFEMLISKCHLEEVDAKEFHEEKETEKSREYSSNIGKDIK